jgi:chemotaxis protein CheX
MARTLTLPEIIDVVAVGPLHKELCGLRGEDLQLDASNVQRVGGLGLQVLLSAVATWQGDGHRVVAINASPAFQETIRLSGASLGGHTG